MLCDVCLPVGVYFQFTVDKGEYPHWLLCRGSYLPQFLLNCLAQTSFLNWSVSLLWETHTGIHIILSYILYGHTYYTGIHIILSYILYCHTYYTVIAFIFLMW